MGDFGGSSSSAQSQLTSLLGTTFGQGLTQLTKGGRAAGQAGGRAGGASGRVGGWVGDLHGAG